MINAVQFLILLFFGIIITILIIEPLHVVVFNKPIYIHWYPFRHSLSNIQIDILRKKNTFYQRLSAKKKLVFEHRTAAFLAK